MTAGEVLHEIRMLGGRVEARGDRIRVDAPKGALNPEHRQLLATLKPEVLALLQTKGDEELLESRMERLGVRIAIDRATGAALLVFTDADADAVHGVAVVQKPYEVMLTIAQRRELTADLDYYERIIRRQTER